MTKREEIARVIAPHVDFNKSYKTHSFNQQDKIQAWRLADRLLSIYDITEKE